MNYLHISDLSLSFGGLKALSGVSLDTRQGEIFGVIGPNGAGKTTLFNVIAGVYKPLRGSVAFLQRPIGGLAVDRIARLGIGRTFQAATVFKGASVRQNLLRAGEFARHPFPSLGRLLRSAQDGASADIQAEADAVLQFIAMQELAEAEASSLAYGHQKVLGVGMAMMTRPKMVLMDEPAAGLNSTEKVTMKNLIRRMRDERGISVLVVEHDMSLIMDVCDRILVLNRGVPIMTGTPQEVQAHPEVIDAYLGSEEHAAA